MFLLVRSLTWSSLFIAFVLILYPRVIVRREGFIVPTEPGVAQIAGGLLVVAGGVLALSCIAAFLVKGKGTPAPFDPPRHLVTRGPYARVRNPMYLGAVIALLGAAWYYHSLALMSYAAGFWLVTQIFVLRYEEPTLLKTFGSEYADYCARVPRWFPWDKPSPISQG